VPREPNFFVPFRAGIRQCSLSLSLSYSRDDNARRSVHLKARVNKTPSFSRERGSVPPHSGASESKETPDIVGPRFSAERTANAFYEGIRDHPREQAGRQAGRQPASQPACLPPLPFSASLDAARPAAIQLRLVARSGKRAREFILFAFNAARISPRNSQFPEIAARRSLLFLLAARTT